MRRADRSRGAVAVEAALVICFILVPLTMGIITYGYMLSFRQSISQAAAEGARAAAVATVSDPRRIAIAEDVVGRVIGTPCSEAGLLRCKVLIPAPGCATCVEVSVEYRYADDPSKPILMPRDALPSQLTYTAVVEKSQ